MPTKGPPALEILEAGTGHGALTLYLAKAIHAANAPQLEDNANSGPPEDRGSTWNEPDIAVDGGNHGSNNVNTRAVGYERGERLGNLYKHFKDQRRAVIHTVDISSKHSARGKAIVEGFRQGMYAGNVEFHVGDVSNWIDEQILSRSSSLKDEPFLSHVILECLPLHLERVLELGPNMTGGREWDVRFVKSRDETRSGIAEAAELVNDRDRGTSDDNPGQGATVEAAEIEKRDHEEIQALEKQDTAWLTICRPKVGQRVLAGGFLGVWKKMK